MKKLIIVVLLACSLTSCSKQPGKEIAIVAHRGYWNCEEAGYSQNSIASLRCAQEAGFWGSELDVQITADDSLVVFHDAAIGESVISTTPWSAFADYRLNNGEKIPSLDEYLIQAAKCSTTKLILEIKEADTPEREILLTDLCLEALDRHGLLDPSRVVFISFRPNVCEYLGKIVPEFVTEALWNFYAPDGYIPRNIRGADLHEGVFRENEALVDSLHSQGVTVNCWTINNDESLAWISNLGVDEITTDVPMRAREVLSELGISEKIIK